MMTQYDLWKIAHRAKPDVRFLARLDKTLAKHGAQTAPLGIAMTYVRLASAVGAIVLTTFVGTSAYAYASSAVLPDSLLYPLREYVESIEERTALTPEDKIAARAKREERDRQDEQRMRERDKKNADQSNEHSGKSEEKAGGSSD